jgi:sortase B
MSIAAAATKLGRQAIRVVNTVINTAVLIAILLLLVIGSYAVWDSAQVYQAADATQYEIYRPTAEDGGRSFEELRSINPDVFAWLTVYGTHINYPVTQGSDNMEYINTNAEGKYSLTGSIFLDANSSRDFSDFSSILYGHHMEKQAMFGEVGLFAGKDYFDARKYGSLYFDGKPHGLEILAFIQADAYDSSVFRTAIEGTEAQQAYLDMLLKMARHTRDLAITTNDRLVLLSTCSASTTNGRDIILARIKDEEFNDPFILEETRKPMLPAVDSLPGLWTEIPGWGKAAIIALPLLLVVLCVVTLLKRHKKYSRRRREYPKNQTETHNKEDE